MTHPPTFDCHSPPCKALLCSPVKACILVGVLVMGSGGMTVSPREGLGLDAGGRGPGSFNDEVDEVGCLEFVERAAEGVLEAI